MILDQSMQSHTACTCLSFLRCAFSNVSSKRLNKRMHSHTGCMVDMVANMMVDMEDDNVADMVMYLVVINVGHTP